MFSSGVGAVGVGGLVTAAWWGWEEPLCEWHQSQAGHLMSELRLR